MSDEMKILIVLANHLNVTIMVSGGDIEGSAEIRDDLFLRNREGVKHGSYTYTIRDKP